MQAFPFLRRWAPMWSQAFLAETVETGDKYLGVPKARSRELFRNESVHGFYRLKALLLITLEQVNTSVVVNRPMKENPDSGIGEIFACGIRNPGKFFL